jgi:hypothetical protein
MLALAAFELREKTPVAMLLADLLALSMYLSAKMLARGTVLAFPVPVAAAGFWSFEDSVRLIENDGCSSLESPIFKACPPPCELDPIVSFFTRTTARSLPMFMSSGTIARQNSGSNL